MKLNIKSNSRGVIMAMISYINTERDGLCMWSETTKEFIPLKSIAEYYEKVANEMGFSLYDDDIIND